MVAETEKARLGISLIKWLTSVVFPEPEGAEKIKSFPLFMVVKVLLYNEFLTDFKGLFLADIV